MNTGWEQSKFKVEEADMPTCRIQNWVMPASMYVLGLCADSNAKKKGRLLTVTKGKEIHRLEIMGKEW